MVCARFALISIALTAVGSARSALAASASPSRGSWWLNWRPWLPKWSQNGAKMGSQSELGDIAKTVLPPRRELTFRLAGRGPKWSCFGVSVGRPLWRCLWGTFGFLVGCLKAPGMPKGSQRSPQLDPKSAKMGPRIQFLHSLASKRELPSAPSTQTWPKDVEKCAKYDAQSIRHASF